MKTVVLKINLLMFSSHRFADRLEDLHPIVSICDLHDVRLLPNYCMWSDATFSVIFKLCLQKMILMES